MFRTVTNLAEKIDPVKLNLTLSATAEALTGLGTKFGKTLVDTNVALDNLNPGSRACSTECSARGCGIYTAYGPGLLGRARQCADHRPHP